MTGSIVETTVMASDIEPPRISSGQRLEVDEARAADVQAVGLGAAVRDQVAAELAPG